MFNFYFPLKGTLGRRAGFLKGKDFFQKAIYKKKTVLFEKEKRKRNRG